MSKAKYYNEDLKFKFATEADAPSSYKRFAKQLFVHSYSREDELQKDISEWPREEIIDFLERNSSHAYGTFKTRIFSLNSYISWANKNFIPVEISEVDFSKVQRYHLIASPSGLQNKLDSVFEPIVMNSNDIVFRTGYWLIFMGVPSQKIDFIDSSEVDLKNEFVLCDGVKYKIPKEAIQTFKKCKSLKEFIMYATNIYPVSRYEGTLFLRGVKWGKGVQDDAEFGRDSVLKRALRKALKKKVSITVDVIKRSGVFYRMYQLEKEGIAPNYLQAYSEFAEGASDWIRNNRKSVYISSTKIEYEAWKKAFYPETKI